MPTCHDVANYLLLLSDEDAGDLISNLKIQKLLYYAQGFSLALLGQPLFQEPIQAWTHGPVVPAVYERFKKFGSGAILKDDDADISALTQEHQRLLDEVYSVYGQYSAWKLRNMTHEESPWKDAAPYQEISHDALREFFASQIG